ncbi:MAG TPA: RecX family transcriptional regulator [Patescibacteria group bacterium]|nr:RecX family transcriptional regulator [Patescibacteria group bacterium]
MRITRITEQIRNPERVSVFFDGKYGFSLNLDQLLQTKLKTGDEIDGADLKVYKKLSQDGKLKMRTLEWLMIRPRSAKELRDYLYRKKLEPEEINGWLFNFQEKKYQNDGSFARWWIEQRRNKQRSSSFIKHELRSKGVTVEIIDEALNESGIDDRQVLKELIVKKRHLAKYQDNQKLAEYLMRQGYHYSLIKEELVE